MTTTTTPRAATTPDLRRTARIFAAILLPVGPACIALLRFVLPYNLTDSAEESIAGIAAEPGRQSAVVWLGFVALLTLVPAVIWVGRVTKREAPRLTAAAMVLLVPAYTALGLLVASDAVAWQGIDEGHDRAMLADLFAPSHPVMAVEAGIFVAGHVLGTILLGLAMLRTAGVPQVGGHRHHGGPAAAFHGCGDPDEPDAGPVRLGPQRCGLRSRLAGDPRPARRRLGSSTPDRGLRRSHAIRVPR